MNLVSLFITGATGFIGRELVSHLVQQKKYSIKALVRDEKKASFLDPSVELVTGDLADRQSYENSLEGVDTVIHLAGQIPDVQTSRESYYKSNVQGTKELMVACKKVGVKKFIHCSTSSVYGSKSNGAPRTENSTASPESLYAKTKLDAEKVLSEGFNSNDISLSIIRPPDIYGPGDKRGVKLFAGVQKDSIRLYINRNQIVHPTHVMDVVHAIESIIGKDGLRHEVINIGGEKAMRLIDLTKFTAKLMNKTIVQISIPQWALPIISFFALAGYKLVGRKCPFEWKVASRVIDHSNDISKAERLLDFKPVSFQKGMEETYDWYVKNNYLEA